MNMKVLVFFVSTILVAWQCHGSEYQIFPLEMKSGSSYEDVKCTSWRLGVEAHNIRKWETIPEDCVDYIAEYMKGEQFRQDSKLVNQEAYFFARSLNFTYKTKPEIWVLSVDGTALSNLPYYAEHGYGSEPFNSTAYDEWVNRGEAPTLPETLKNYNFLIELGYKIVFLSGRTEDKREVTEANLKAAGFSTWEQLILKDPVAYDRESAISYKSEERRKLIKQGYRIVGNIGDQWSDLLGKSKGHSLFKLPNPMYCIH